jgi:threonine dehydrogenase-like Zn-dependent dehydrogenase
MNTTQRRTFLKQAGLGAVALGVGHAAVHAQQADRIVVGVIGVGGMGGSHLANLAARKDVEVAYVCDPDQQRLAAAAQRAASTSGRTPKAVKDLRQNAVFIATPDHWHAPPRSSPSTRASTCMSRSRAPQHSAKGGCWPTRSSGAASCCRSARKAAAPNAFEAIQRIARRRDRRVLVAKAWNSQRRGSIGKTSRPNRRRI